MRVISNVPQRSQEWFQVRAGLLTASVAHVPAMVGRKKGEESTTRRDLRFKLALERINGAALEESFTGNADTERGVAIEAEALAAYEAKTGHLLSPVGFVSSDDLLIGCSPDGAILNDAGEIVGGCEIKCPRPANHNAYRLDPSLLVAEYEAQIAHTLLVTDAPFWDLCSYCPQMPAPLRLVIVRLVPAGPVGGALNPHNAVRVQGVDLAAHELNVRLFLDEVDAQEAALRQAAQEAA